MPEEPILGTVSDKHNLDITVILDHIPEGCDYDIVLYDGDGNQVGIGQDNGNGGKSVTVPNWNLENREYTVKVLAKDGSPVNAEEYYHLSFQTQQSAKDNALRQQAEEMQKYALALRKKLHDGQDAAEEKQALQQIREKYEAYYKQQMDGLHKQQAAEYLPEGETFDGNWKDELLSKMAAGDELTEQERGLVNIFASAQEIDSATASAKLKTDISEKIFREIEQSGISPCPSFEVRIGIDGKIEVEGIEDGAVKKQLEDILNGYSGELMDTYVSVNASMQGMNKQEQYIVKAAMGIEKFLQKATGGNTSLADITVENGRIKGLDSPLDKLLNDLEQNQTYLDYRADILAIKNYERQNGKSLLEGVRAKYTVERREKEKNVQRDIDDGIIPCGGELTVLQLVTKYIKQKTGVRHNTQANYNFVINVIKKEEFGTRRIDKVKLSDAKEWLIKMQSEDGRGYSSIHSIRGVVRPAFQMAVDDDLIRKNPFEFQLCTVVVNDSVTREAITRKQERKFLEFIKSDGHYKRYYDGMFLLFKTGLRISEFCGLTLSDIDLNEKQISVNHQLQRTRDMRYVIEDTKTTSGTRLIPMTEEVYECVKRIVANCKKPKIEPMIDGYSGFLFLDKKDMPEVALHWEKHFSWALAKYNRIYREQLPKITPHVCRHTYCSNMAKSGMNPKTLQYLMGHSDIGVTLNTYTHVSLNDAKDELERISKLA